MRTCKVKLGHALDATYSHPHALTIHTENSVMQISNCTIDEKKNENFWNLELLGIQEKMNVQLVKKFYLVLNL